MSSVSCRKSSVPEVHLYTWDSYGDPEVFEEFERKTGARVVVDYFASNEELLAKLMGGAKGYDLIVPSDYMVAIMAKQGLLAELDPAAIPNRGNLDPRLMGLYYDPGNRYSLPYLWGMTGIAYDGEAVSPAPDSWRVFWDPRFKSRNSLLNDEREVFAMALQSLGRSANSRDPADLEAAKERLLAQKKLVRTYVSENQKYLLISGEVLVAQAWSGDVNQAAEEKPSLRFVMPKEGGFLWQDNLCIPAGSQNKEAALRLMDFLLEPANAARLARKTKFGTPNRAAWKLLPDDLRSNPTIVPQDAVFERAEWIHDIGDAGPVYDRLWTELKAG